MGLVFGLMPGLMLGLVLGLVPVPVPLPPLVPPGEQELSKRANPISEANNEPIFFIIPRLKYR